MTNNDTPSRQELARRVAALEHQIRDLHPLSAAHDVSRPLYCAVPAPPPRQMQVGISTHRARLVQYTGAKWVNETVLHYYFFENAFWGAGDEQKDIVRAAFDVWRDVGVGLRFEEATNIGAAEVRIGFQTGDGYWSGIGTTILNIGQVERTMNFGQDLTQDPRGVDVPVHEIGHTLGFPHEHQNPIAGIVWDEQAVVDYFTGPPNNWTMEEIEINVLRKIPRSQVEGSEWDPDSIMHYAFNAGLIRVPTQYQNQPLTPQPGLSTLDQEQALFFYPPPQPSTPTLNVFESTVLSLAPGEQANFRFAPSTTREYTIQTFGFTDSVIVLFENDNGVPVYVAGDDDSGWNRNARLEVRLYAGREYVLRVRMYYQWASGKMAVMIW